MKEEVTNMKVQNILQSGTGWALITLALSSACTQQLGGTFRYQQQEETFTTSEDVNTKIDLLWVVDNSASMDVAQSKLRNGFSTFADKYMQPTWDIRVAVITTDTYLADSAFSSYLNTTIPGSAGWTSTHQGITYPSGVKYGDLIPDWDSNYSRLLDGVHDGPIAATCFELQPYFFKGLSDCKIRDAGTQTGPSKCITPDVGQTSITQCVNTTNNNTVRSGKAIINTSPGGGSIPAGWTQQLVKDFIVNITKGSSGHGSERGLASVLQLLEDNESTGTKFFRQGSVRGIIFVSDEEDQSLAIPSSPPAGFGPYTGYECDQNGLLAMNPQAKILGSGGTPGYCCSGATCTFKPRSGGCPSKTVDGHTYTPSLCLTTASLIPVSTVKSTLDSFFLNLDGSGATDPNYFVSAIVPLTAASIQDLQAARTTEDTSVGAVKTIAADRGDRYMSLASLVGGDSASMDIGASNYDAILDSIGQAIIAKRGTFNLTRLPSGEEEMLVTWVQANGSQTLVDPSKYEIQGNKLVLTDMDFILGLGIGDKIVINYQPATAG